MKTEVNWIENQGEKWYKILKTCLLIHFGKKLD